MATVIIQIMGSLLILQGMLQKKIVLFSNTTIFQSIWSNMMKFGDIGAKCSQITLEVNSSKMEHTKCRILRFDYMGVIPID